MTQVFTEDGRLVPVTVIEAGPCTVTMVKTQATDGYEAVQVGFGELSEQRAKKLLNKLLKIKGLEFINVERACTVSSAVYETQLSERRVARKFLTNLIKK